MTRPSITLVTGAFTTGLLPDLERSFAIKFGQDDFAQALTVGDVLQVVKMHLLVCRINDETLPSSIPRVRAQLCQTLTALGVSPLRMTPAAQLHELLPLFGRRKLWKRLQEKTGLLLPALSMPAKLFMTWWAIGALGALLVAPTWWMAVMTGLSFALIFSNYSFSRIAPPSMTLDALAEMLVLDHYHVVNGDCINWQEVQQIVLAQLVECSIDIEEQEGEISPVELGKETNLVWYQGES